MKQNRIKKKTVFTYFWKRLFLITQDGKRLVRQFWICCRRQYPVVGSQGVPVLPRFLPGILGDPAMRKLLVSAHGTWLL